MGVRVRRHLRLGNRHLPRARTLRPAIRPEQPLPVLRRARRPGPRQPELRTLKETTDASHPPQTRYAAGGWVAAVHRTRASPMTAPRYTGSPDDRDCLLYRIYVLDP